MTPATPASKAFQPQEPGQAGTLPALYACWIETAVHGPLPVETEADCDNCVMCPRPGEPAETGQCFDSGSRCCTYTPTLANFMAGAILNDPAAAMTAGKATLAERLVKGIGVNPLAVHPPPSYALLYRHSKCAFGRNSALRCPYLDAAAGLCTIWPYRDPTCATWFCKHLRGKIGQSFWKALQNFLNTVTKELSLWCVLQLDIGDEALALIKTDRAGEANGENLTPNELDGRFDGKAARKTWGRWRHRESEFYSECARLVAGLDLRDMERICGPEVQATTRLVRTAAADLQDTRIPTRLQIGHFNVDDAEEDAVRVWSYSRFDPLDLPVPIYMALSYFDGRPTAEALSMMAHDLGTHLDDRQLRTLIDFGILESRQEPE